MKKTLIALSLFLLTSCANGTETSEVLKEEIENPHEQAELKTVDFLNDNPFDTDIHPVVLAKWIDDGYTIFTIEDGEELETRLKKSLQEREKEIKETEEDLGINVDREIFQARAYTNILKVFEKNILRDYPDMETYTNLLKEASRLIIEEDETAVVEKVEEAAELRKIHSQ